MVHTYYHFPVLFHLESFFIFTDGTTTTTFVKSQENGIYWNQDIWNIDYQAILPLRCLLAKHSTSWNYLQKFMDHCEVRCFEQNGNSKNIVTDKFEFV